MNKLGTLVKKGRIVFICLNHKIITLGKTRGKIKIFCYTTYQKSRLQARCFQNPRQHTRGRRFTMCTGHSQHMTMFQDYAHLTIADLR